MGVLLCVSGESLSGPSGGGCLTQRAGACRLPPPEGWLEDLLAVAGVGGVEVDAGLDDLVDAVEDRRVEHDVGGGQLAVELLQSCVDR